MAHNEICYLTAIQMRDMIRSRELSAVEVMEAHLRQIEVINPEVNAIITLHTDRAMQGAELADAAMTSGANLGHSMDFRLRLRI